MSTLRTLLLDASSQSPDAVCVRWKAAREWHEWTFADLHARARQVSESLGRLGVRPGDRVALMMENRPEWMSTYLGIVSCGVTAVPVDARLHPHEVSHILRDSEAVAFFGSGKTGPLVREVMGTLKYMRAVVLADGAVSEDRRESGVRLYDYDRLREVNNRFVELSGLPFGFTHAEYRYENGEFYLLEIGARGGGGLLSADVPDGPGRF